MPNVAPRRTPQLVIITAERTAATPLKGEFNPSQLHEQLSYVSARLRLTQ
jgi:hypothetical protein